MSCVYRALTVMVTLAASACAAHAAPPIHHGGHSQSLALAEARAIKAAKHHPNAQPRVRPQYPEQAPPPLPAGTSLPAPLHITRRSAPYADAPAPTNVLVERTVYDDYSYRYRPWYGYGYSYRRPWSIGVGLGWDPYGYGYGYGSYYYPPRVRYGYGYGIGLGLSAPLWGARHLAYPSYGRVHRLGWDRGHHHHWGSGGFGRGFGSRGSNHVRWVSGRRR